MNAWTVGYSTMPPDDFAAMVQAHGIELVADLRGQPGSRRQPWTSRDGMTRLLHRYGIGYAHLPRLGGRRSKQHDVDYRLVDGWRHASFRNYAAFMQTDEFADGMAELCALCAGARVAYLCCEALWWQCHRRLVSDALTMLHGYQVQHIMGARLAPHEPLPCAQVHDGRVVYPKAGTVPLW